MRTSPYAGEGDLWAYPEVVALIATGLQTVAPADGRESLGMVPDGGQERRQSQRVAGSACGFLDNIYSRAVHSAPHGPTPAVHRCRLRVTATGGQEETG